jgi:hypothetical protein
MRHLPKALGAALVIALSGMAMQACKKEIRGCTDTGALNYDPKATESDGKCEYAYTRFLGTYSVHETYSSDGCGNGSDDYTAIITQGGHDKEILLSGLGGGMATVRFNVAGNTMTSPYQEEINSPLGMLDLDEGNGTVSGNTIILNYQVDDILYDHNCGFINSSATMTKQ